ncbi:MAG: DEAD/DEAH box helicase, partial [Phycisphaerales bacterium]|nr:DEAD/DEAH box helicase [Phycisphaerales bacterium]
MQFSSLALCEPLLIALADEGYTTPTPIQAQAIGPAMEGRDILGCAQTGTGKTAAFALPILHKLHTAPVDKTRRGPVLPRALILSPTRELATQIADSFATYGGQTMLTHTVIYGGVSQQRQVRDLQRGVDIIVATPGRLIDLMEQGFVNLSAVSVFVLDEGDRMLDMGFIQPIRRIAGALRAERQTMLFSATMPREIMKLADSLLRSPVKIAVTPTASAVPAIDQSLYMVGRHTKQALLEHLLHEHRIVRAVVFTKTKHGADKVSKRLLRAGITAEAIHGNKAQNKRQKALDKFRAGHSRVLVATDVAARGLDVDGITHVFNFDLPMEAEAYIHRIGRTGRAGASGIALSFCDHEERGLLREIEKLTGKKIPLLVTPTDLPEPAPYEAGPGRAGSSGGHGHERPNAAPHGRHRTGGGQRYSRSRPTAGAGTPGTGSTGGEGHR